MEAKIRIIEISPKIKCFKNDPKDIISISFISDNYSVKIEDLEKAIISNDKVIVNLKESKNKNKYQPIKYSLLKNNNNIIATGEFIPSEGIKWYKLNEIKNNMSKESLITSSTSNGNIKNNNNFTANRRVHNLSDSHNSYANEPLNSFISKSNFNKLNKNSGLTVIKIKFSINLSNKKVFSNKKNINQNNNNHYNSIINNNYTKEPSENSSKYGEILLDKDIFNDEEFTITECELSRINQKKNIATTSKKLNNQKKFTSGLQSKRFSKKKINFHSNHSPKQPALSGVEDTRQNSKTIMTTLNNNSKAFSPTRKTNNLSSKKYLNEDIRMKTSMGFNKRKNVGIIKDKNENNENKFISKKSSNCEEIHRKIKSCENIEDEILDQNFKNYLKNDELLKANLSRNNSYNSLTQNNKGLKNTKAFETNNNDLLEKENISKISSNNEIITDINKFQNNFPQDFNTKSLYGDIQLLKTNSDIESVDNISKNITINNENNSLDNICITNNNKNENFERLKSDFLLLYSKKSICKINNEVLFLEIQLMIEKILDLQKKHQKEYIEVFNSITLNKKVCNNYQSKYISLIKQINKLNTKKIYTDIIDKKNEIYKGNINNFITTRKNIMNKGEFIIWNKMMENSSKAKIKNNIKSKVINIFLNICGKNEINLNKLSIKFYKEIKNKQSKKNGSNKNIEKTNVAKKKGKLDYNSNFSEKKSVNIKMRIKENDTETNLPYLRTNHNIQHNFKATTNKNILKISKKNNTKMSINKDDINTSNSNNMKTMINENTSTHYNNYYNKKIKYYNNNKPSSIGDKKFHKKKGFNKSQ